MKFLLNFAVAAMAVIGLISYDWYTRPPTLEPTAWQEDGSCTEHPFKLGACGVSVSTWHTGDGGPIDGMGELHYWVGAEMTELYGAVQYAPRSGHPYVIRSQVHRLKEIKVDQVHSDNTYAFLATGDTDTSENAISARRENNVLPWLSNRDFVSRVYELILRREPDPDGLDSWSAGLNRHECTRTHVVIAFMMSEEYRNQESARKVSEDLLLAWP